MKMLNRPLPPATACSAGTTRLAKAEPRRTPTADGGNGKHDGQSLDQRAR
jgi:hypothetical protein